MIIATAGHVDHGKTLLVKALTGVDTDRLPEEKKRGMTIDLGFAYLPAASIETVGFVDVPGHERFVHNMLAGVAGVDFALFIIAADDGPMPQTREHLAILDLLGIARGAVALTKIDRVTPQRVSEVHDEITSLFAPTTLAGSPVFPVSAITGEGVEDLKAHLLGEAREWRPRKLAGNFRLAVDRCFRISGAGMIVTGTAVAGALSTGQPVRVLSKGLTLRARMIHAQNAAAPTGRAGQRCAINLAGSGLKHELIERGDWVVTGDVPEPVRKFDARLRVLQSELRPLAHWTPVHVHLGAADVTGRVAILEGSSIAPGAAALVQIALDRPLGALYGDRLIVRDQSAQRTIGGGRVLDIFPPFRGRARPERLAYLTAMNNDDTPSAFASLLRAAPRGLNLDRFARNRNLTAEEAAQIVAGASTKSVATSSGTLGLSPENWNRLKTAEASKARVSTHAPPLSPEDAALWKKAQPLLNQNVLRPPAVSEIAAALAMDPKRMESFLVRVSRAGLLARVAENRFFPPAGVQRYAALVEEIAAANQGSVTGGKLRDRAGIGRTLAIEVLEYFDRIKFTRRSGDEHHVLRPAREMFTVSR